MFSHPPTQPTWDTACVGQPADASALKHTALSAHLTECDAQRAILEAWMASAGAFWQWLAARVVTLGVLGCGLLALALLLR